jgi:hypothetical protein
MVKTETANKKHHTKKKSVITSFIDSIKHFFISLKLKINDKLHSHYKRKHDSLKEKHCLLAGNKENEIKSRLKSLNEQEQGKKQKVEDKFSKKAAKTIDGKYDDRKKEVFSKSTLIGKDVKVSEHDLKNKNNSLNSAIRKRNDCVNEINQIAQSSDHSLPSEEYNGLVRQRYVLQGKIQKAQSSPEHRLPRSQYYALQNKISQLDNIIGKAKKSIQQKERLSKLRSTLPEYNDAVPSLEKDVKVQTGKYNELAEQYDHQYFVDKDCWDDINQKVKEEITIQVMSEYSNDIKKEQDSISEVFQRKKDDVPNAVQTEIDKVENKLAKLKNKVDSYDKKKKKLDTKKD